MKYTLSALLIVLLFQSSLGLAQQNIINNNDDTKMETTVQEDTLASPKHAKSKELQKAIKAPLLLTAIGLFSLTNNGLLNNHEVQDERNKLMPNFKHNADNYLQYAPIVATYGLNLAGVKGKNNFANRTAILIKTQVLFGVVTYSLKKIVAEPRPDTGFPNSFPSGHTAQAFAAATFMSKEYGHINIWYSIGAYTVATGVGAMRIMNNRHWISDVLVGAGIGILSTNLVYLTHQYKWDKKNKRGHTMVMPTYDGQTGMLCMVHQFN